VNKYFLNLNLHKKVNGVYTKRWVNVRVEYCGGEKRLPTLARFAVMCLSGAKGKQIPSAPKHAQLMNSFNLSFYVTGNTLKVLTR
jgi:hypothetical protein